MRHSVKKLTAAMAKAALTAALISSSPWAMNMSAQETGYASQQRYKELTFPKTIHDFGTFSETSGPKTCIFKYKNETDIPIFIRDVVVSCGCTTAKWSGKPLKPDESGEIQVTFTNDTGAMILDKTITVYMSSRVKPKILRIKGIITQGK